MDLRGGAAADGGRDFLPEETEVADKRVRMERRGPDLSLDGAEAAVGSEMKELGFWKPALVLRADEVQGSR